jgi:hypothetical protein
VVFFNTSFAQKAKYQSIFIYNFSKYVKWPEHEGNGGFIIGVLGNSEIQKSLEDMAAMKKSTQGLNINVIKYSDISEIQPCHMLIVADNRLSSMPELQSMPELKNALIITDEPGMAKKGSIINFVEKDGKTRFELNSSEAEKKELKVSTSLTTMAILVE